MDHRAVLTGGPHDGMLLDVPRETNGTLYFPRRKDSPVDAWVEAMGAVMGAEVATVRDRYDIAVPFRLNGSGTAVVYEYVGEIA